MTERESEILRILQQDPMISQEQLAKELNIQRSSVAVHISNLIKKGKIKGKGYILEEENSVVVIGGSNMDISGTPTHDLIMKDSNIGFVNTSLGGVGRNIAENLLRLGVQTDFISAVGNDDFGQRILSDFRSLKMNTGSIMVHPELPTSTYMCINDAEGDMKVAISQMQIVSAIDAQYLNHFHQQLSHAKIIVLDANLDKSVIEFVAKQYADKPLFIDPVSTAKAKRTIDILEHIDYFKPNILEARLILEAKGIRVETDESDVVASAKAYASALLECGVKNLAISIGSHGVLYASGKECFHIPNYKVDVINTTGAGDAFMAGWISAVSRDCNAKEAMAYALACSGHNVTQGETVSKKLNPLIIEEMIKDK